MPASVFVSVSVSVSVDQISRYTEHGRNVADTLQPL